MANLVLPSLWTIWLSKVQFWVLLCGISSSVDGSIEHIGWSCQTFADDLSANKRYPAAASNDDILQEVQACQNTNHEWGARNPVAVDLTKEIVIIHHRDGYGTPFTFPGPVVDPKLTMHDAVDKFFVTPASKSGCF